MKFEVYCDESCPDLLRSYKPLGQFMVIGSLWLPGDEREAFKNEIHELRNRHRIGGEFKWQKISPSRQAFYVQLVEWFHGKGERLRFRCISVDRQQVDLKLYHQDDQELGFYKFYYQVLHHWILDFNEYAVFVDFKSSRRRDRLPVLRRCLGYSNLSSVVSVVQAVRSEESVLIELTDVLTGMAAYRLNNQVRGGRAKSDVLSHCERLLGRRIGPTYKSEQKFNVFRINLAGAGEVAYPPLLSLADVAAYRARFEATYCRGPIRTFDGVEVRFRKRRFDHCFFESSRRDRVKDQFSIRRAERLDWIEAAVLNDPKSERYQGWDGKRKRYDPTRRVTLVMGNYVVVIAMKGRKRADFVTAYVADTSGTPGRPSTVDLIRRTRDGA